MVKKDAGENVGILDHFVAVQNHQRPLARAALMQHALDLARLAKALFARLLDRDLQRTIQDQPQGALIIVLNHEHDRPREIRIGQSRRSQQKFALGGIHGIQNDIAFFAAT